MKKHLMSVFGVFFTKSPQILTAKYIEIIHKQSPTSDWTRPNFSEVQAPNPRQNYFRA